MGKSAAQVVSNINDMKLYFITCTEIVHGISFSQQIDSTLVLPPLTNYIWIYVFKHEQQ